MDQEKILRDVPTELFLGGVWRPASDGARIPVRDPATGAEIASVASASVDDGLAAVAAAHDAASGWAGTAPRARVEILRRAFVRRRCWRTCQRGRRC